MIYWMLIAATASGTTLVPGDLADLDRETAQILLRALEEAVVDAGAGPVTTGAPTEDRCGAAPALEIDAFAGATEIRVWLRTCVAYPGEAQPTERKRSVDLRLDAKMGWRSQLRAVIEPLLAEPALAPSPGPAPAPPPLRAEVSAQIGGVPLVLASTAAALAATAVVLAVLHGNAQASQAELGSPTVEQLRGAQAPAASFGAPLFASLSVLTLAAAVGWAVAE